MCCLQLGQAASPKAMAWFPVQEAEVGIPSQPAVLKDHQQHLGMAGMDQSRDEGPGSNASPPALPGPCRVWRGQEDCRGEMWGGETFH